MTAHYTCLLLRETAMVKLKCILKHYLDNWSRSSHLTWQWSYSDLLLELGYWGPSQSCQLHSHWDRLEAPLLHSLSDWHHASSALHSIVEENRLITTGSWSILVTSNKLNKSLLGRDSKQFMFACLIFKFEWELSHGHRWTRPNEQMFWIISSLTWLKFSIRHINVKPLCA